MCVLCGQPQSVDTWEDHSLTHRNPRMTWSGIQLTRPQRIVLSHRQSKVYRCYLCARRFVTRFGCQRHLTGLHKLAKSRINWDSLIDTDCTRGARHSTLEASEGSDSQFTSFSQTTQSHPSAPILSWSSGDQPRSQQSLSYTMGNQQVSPPRASSDTVWLRPNTDTHTDHQQSECGGSDIHCCTICQIPFLSHRSLSIHQAAAHVSTV
ncbi:unnamed protein product [Dicrocoelium dendriticum]|nr:unnamed protein product [Dicrocoelium dendriticum]